MSNLNLNSNRTRSKPPPPGVYVPCIVFFDENEELDLESTRSHYLRMAKAGVTGILIQGSNGEAAHLSRAEKSTLVRLARSTLDAHGYKDVVVIAGTGAASAKETIELCHDADEAGAGWALVLMPGVWMGRMGRAEILAFFRRVADASSLPIMIYNFPTVTAGLDIDSDVLLELANHPNIVGTKLSCGNIGKLIRVVGNRKVVSKVEYYHHNPESRSSNPNESKKEKDVEFAVFAGKSDVFFPALQAGGAGGIMALANLFPRIHVKMYGLYKSYTSTPNPSPKILTELSRIQSLLSASDWAVQKLGGVSGVKALVARFIVNDMSFIGDYDTTVRSPLLSINSLNDAVADVFENGGDGAVWDVLRMERRMEEEVGIGI